MESLLNFSYEFQSDFKRNKQAAIFFWKHNKIQLFLY